MISVVLHVIGAMDTFKDPVHCIAIISWVTVVGSDTPEPTLSLYLKAEPGFDLLIYSF